MKKLFFLAAVLVGLSALGFAGDWKDMIPTGPDNALQSADYGGVQVATTNVVRYSSSPLFIPGPSTVYGVIWSSNTQRELPFFVTFSQVDPSSTTNVYSSTSSASEITRLYYSSMTSAGQVNLLGDMKWFMYPLYSETGWIAVSSTQTFSSVCIPFNRKRVR